MPPHLVLPRPNTPFTPKPPIPAPTEASFTTTFGALLPPATYLTLPAGRAAYYVFPATASPPPAASKAPQKVLLIHGVQTPALGLLPLITELRNRYPGTAFATLDLWGHGLSDTPVAPHEGVLFWELIHGVLCALGWENGDGVGVVGYSFGAVLGMGYLTSSYPPPARVGSMVLVAPAGLLKKSWFTEQERGVLGEACADGDEGEAVRVVIKALEGRELPIVVPADWEMRVERGEVVAQAVKKWLVENHGGHVASVVGVFRDGGVMDNEGLFGRARKLGVKALVVLGERDGMSTQEEIEGLGFEVKVVGGAGHGVVRENVGEVAGLIGGFWDGL